MQIRMQNLNGSTAIFKDPNVTKRMSLLHYKYDLSLPTRLLTILFMCKSHYVECLITELY